MNIKEDKKEKYNSWWKNLSEEDQIWIMMKYGFDNPFNPKRISSEEIEKLYFLEN